MKIVIIGLGTIGKTILKNLSGESHTITIIDEDKNCIENLIEKYDIMGVVGNGASMDIQNEAGVADAQLVIALTRSDELNILACLVAKMKVTTRILYLIYLGLTVLEVIILMLDKPIPGYENDQFFFSLLATFGCASTGGFGFIPGSMELFHPFSQHVMAIFLAALFLLAFDPVNGQVLRIVSDAGTHDVEHGFFSNFSAVLACISNVGPAFEAVGPYSSYAGYSSFSMVVLMFTMLLGRLEILPVLILFNRRTWKKV